jgi:hypothetical protein
VVAAEPALPSPLPAAPMVPVLPMLPALPTVGPGCTAPARVPLFGVARPVEPVEPSAVDPRDSGAAPAGPAMLPGAAPGVVKPVPGTVPVAPGPTPLVAPDESMLGPLQGGVPGLVVIWAVAKPAAAMDAVSTTARPIDPAFMNTSSGD